MPTELHWPRRSTFHEPAATGSDENTEERYFEGPGTFEVPDEMVEQYLDRGWERPDEAGGDEAPPAASQEPEEADTEGSEPDADEADAEGFDAAGFVDDSWQSVTTRIEDGEADDHLDAVEAAERDRDGEPRSSVIEAVEDQR